MNIEKQQKKDPEGPGPTAFLATDVLIQYRLESLSLKLFQTQTKPLTLLQVANLKGNVLMQNQSSAEVKKQKFF